MREAIVLAALVTSASAAQFPTPPMPGNAPTTQRAAPYAPPRVIPQPEYRQPLTTFPRDASIKSCN